MIKRLKRAFHFSEVQIGPIFFFTLLNVLAYFSGERSSILFLIGCILFWPALAVFFNFIDLFNDKKE